MRWVLGLLIAFAGATALGAQTVHTAKQPGTVAAVAPAPPAPTGRAERAGHRRESGQLVRSCNAASASGASGTVAQPSIVQPSVTQPRIGASGSLPYTPPIPAQATASQQLARQGQTASTAAAYCETKDGRGPLVGARP
jgi:hypothetical protein